MRPPYHVPLWKQAPVIRLLLPLIAGIILQWYLQFSMLYVLTALCCFITAFLLINLLPAAVVFGIRQYRGILFHFVMAAFGMLLTWQKDARHHNSWYGHFLKDSSVLIVKINEPLMVKQRSVKTEGIVTAVVNGKDKQVTGGKLLLYFAKDSTPVNLQYGDIIVIHKKLQPIINSGNPGAFNYKRYAAFQLLYHQVFLKKENWLATNKFSVNYLQHYLFKTRDHVLGVLKKYISNKNNELGIAEALLIGYKEDLDKDLVQAYSNTGVVHIIAISGLHLGLIYAVLLWSFNHIPYVKRSRHAKAILLITSLWLFALLTGGSASVLRSAVMFTVIVAGKYYFKQSSVYNSLAASAFILLCYNPYYLWDVGFQLSYCAVTGIIAFQQFIYRKWYSPYRVLRQVWQMISITLAAQIGTFPLCIYYFHQFPNLFLFTNLLAVPVSTGILFAEILLVIVASFETFAGYIGVAISSCINMLNKLILFFDEFSFSVIDHIYANEISTWLMYGMVTLFMAWWMRKNKKMLRLALLCMLLLSGLYAYTFVQLQQQQKIVIYNISRQKAVDFIDKDRFVFTGDSIMMKDGLQKNFHLKPARIALQAKNEQKEMQVLRRRDEYWQFHDKKLLFVDSASTLAALRSPPVVDVLLFSHNPVVDIKELLLAVKPGVVVFDASNSLWKIQQWKSACEELLLRFHSVPEQGAFVLEIE